MTVSHAYAAEVDHALSDLYEAGYEATTYGHKSTQVD